MHTYVRMYVTEYFLVVNIVVIVAQKQASKTHTFPLKIYSDSNVTSSHFYCVPRRFWNVITVGRENTKLTCFVTVAKICIWTDG